MQEGEQPAVEVSEATEGGTTYVLIHDHKSWSEARDICIASHGGKIAHLQTDAQMDHVVDLMGAAGVNNAW